MEFYARQRNQQLNMWKKSRFDMFSAEGVLDKMCKTSIDATLMSAAYSLAIIADSLKVISESIEEELDELPSAEPVKAYTKADYIMALHKEYGCTLTMAEEAHNKALEYLRSKARMKG